MQSETNPCPGDKKKEKKTFCPDKVNCLRNSQSYAPRIFAMLMLISNMKSMKLVGTLWIPGISPFYEAFFTKGSITAS